MLTCSAYVDPGVNCLADLIATPETLESIASIQKDSSNHLDWNLIFTLPDWLRTWWEAFGSDSELYIRSFRKFEQIVGMAPLKILEGTASVIGSVDVCDYQDFIWATGFEDEFSSALLRDLTATGVKRLLLESIRPDSLIANKLVPLAKRQGLSVDCQPQDVSLDMKLASNFEDYLAGLDGKRRHEIRRKLRNINSLGDVNYRAISEKSEVLTGIGTFLQLFPEYRRDKAEFLTQKMNDYFRSIAANLAGANHLCFGSLELGSKVVAMIMYFDYNENVYLYNSAYDPAYKNMSVGIISKALCVQDSIQRGKKRFDFLKGNEQYKYYLGGQEIPLSRYEITLQ
jgi:CelD/BcsL family acetyltransferase involved in cellulose biosynthesis